VEHAREKHELSERHACRLVNQWSYDFVSAMTHDGRTIRMLTMIDEYTRECLGIRVARRLGSYEVIEALADVMLWRGVPENIRSLE
jgi:putative transposase